MDVYSAELGIRLSFVKTSDFGVGWGLNPPGRHWEIVSHLEQQIEGEWGAIRVTSCLCFLTCYPWIWQCFKVFKVRVKVGWLPVSPSACAVTTCNSFHCTGLWWHTVPGVGRSFGSVRLGSGSFHIRLIFSRGTGWLTDWLTGWLAEQVCKWRARALSLSLSLSLSLPRRCLPSECHDARVNVI
jgi:hypothetical protein